MSSRARRCNGAGPSIRSNPGAAADRAASATQIRIEPPTPLDGRSIPHSGAKHSVDRGDGHAHDLGELLAGDEIAGLRTWWPERVRCGAERSRASYRRARARLDSLLPARDLVLRNADPVGERLLCQSGGLTGVAQTAAAEPPFHSTTNLCDRDSHERAPLTSVSAVSRASCGIQAREDWMMPSPSADLLAYLGPLLNHSEDAIVACDADWRVTLWNEGARRMFGWTAEEAVGHPATFVGVGESDAQRMDRRRQLAEQGRWRGEITVQRKDGSEVPVESVVVAIRDEQGGISGYLGIHRDITERKRAERTLHEAHRKTATILESISEWFGALDADWRYTYMNRRALERAGKALGEELLLEDVLGRRIWDVFPELVGSTIDHEYHRAVREQKTVVFETYSPLIDSWVEVHAYPSQDGGLSIYALDLTERKQAEEALREANRRIETILESIGDHFFAMDGEWRITYMNQRALANSRRAGGDDLSLDDLLGKNYWKVFPETVGTAIDHEFHRAVREQEMVGFEIVDPLSARWLGIRAYPTDHGLSVYSRDITERKEAEQRVVEARQAERGRIARALHDEALQGLSEAIALVAVADRSPLEQRLAGQLLPVLRRVGEQLRSAIYDLRLGTEEHRPFVELLEQLVHEHRAMVGECEIQLEIADRVPRGSLGAQGIEVQRILGEALTNARRHGEARHVRVRVWGTKDGIWAEVSDDGSGFDTASRVSPIHRGITGMRERAELLNGRLELHSEPGVGTTVRLEAPLANGTSGDS